MRRQPEAGLGGRDGASPVLAVAQHVDQHVVGSGVLRVEGERAAHDLLRLGVAVLAVEGAAQPQQGAARPGVTGQHVAEALLRLDVAAQVEELLGVGERPPVRPSTVHGAHPDRLAR